MAPSHIPIPTKLPLLVVSNGVLFPGSTIRIPVTTVRNINLVRSRLTSDSRLASTVIGIVTKEPSKVRGPEWQALTILNTIFGQGR
ncbi:Lon protease 2, peroxisomal [Portunus trituberculatus]|uniref:Lon protease 2, peroxisomal n=1 Tax=Portunus trituberculatus TaxID=210409 RepID=A0A5B7CVX0_PORTR|nr:Lon protease 2, peroxisomal [Portunus trituberculatus]